MLRLWPLALAACWTGPVPREPVDQAPVTCRIHDLDIETPNSIELRLNGKVFATLEPELARLDATISGTRARATIETTGFDLTGDLRLEDAPLRPRKPQLTEGWLGIGAATGREALGGSLRVSVKLPVGFQPATVATELPCQTLTFGKLADEDPPADAEWIGLAPGTISVLRAPGGPVLATFTPAAAPVEVEEVIDVRVLERRGAHLRVRIGNGTNAVEGWVPRAAARPASGEAYGGLLGGLIGSSSHEVACTRAIAIYVRDGRQVVQVGRYKPSAKIELEGDRQGPEVGVVLGASELTPFVKRSALNACVDPW
jgi:hypothetical protein